MSDKDEKKIKVTDKRMFAPDGTLREEYRFIEEEARKKRAEKAAAQPSSESSGARGRDTAPPPGRPEPPDLDLPPGIEESRGGGSEPAELPGGSGRKPSFFDLVAALAEPASVYLRNAVQSPAEASQSLEVARLYIDLLDVLRQKSAGNLSAQESDMLEDALQQLRLGYVQTKG
ncbi:MAG: DUF1844 domain-containing protein [Acidobacteriota bacterium]